MSDTFLMGVDVGTTQTKVGLFDLKGELIASSRAGYSLNIDHRTNAAEQSPTDWWLATTKAIREILKHDREELARKSIG